MNDVLLEKINKLYDNDKHDEIISLIKNIDGYENDYDLQGQLARAYSNIQKYDKAITILELFKDKGATDPIWVYRLAFACCEGDREYSRVQKYLENILKDIPQDRVADEIYNDLSGLLIGCLANDINNISFKKRVENFWIWFADNEATLSNMITMMNDEKSPTDLDAMSSLVRSGLSLISDKLQYNLGGDFEFTFTCADNPYLFYLTPFIVSQIPEKFKSKWTFNPFMDGNVSNDLELEIKDVTVGLSDMLVAVEYQKDSSGFNDSSRFNIQFFNEHVCKLDDSDAYHIFFLMMDIVIGESISYQYINTVNKSETKTDEMIPLTDLKQYIIDQLQNNKKQFFNNPQDRFTYFTLKLKADQHSPLRYNVRQGGTTFRELFDSYYANDNKINLSLLSMGAVAVFIILSKHQGSELTTLDHDDYNEAGFHADDLAKKIVAQTSSIYTGVLDGSYIYIDFITYDLKEFLEKVPTIIKQGNYNCTFLFSYFKPYSEIISLT